MSIQPVKETFGDNPQVNAKINELVKEMNETIKFIGTVKLEVKKLQKDFEDFKKFRRNRG